MSVQKKSLISQRSAVKAAILANPTQSVGSAHRYVRQPAQLPSGSSRRRSSSGSCSSAPGSSRRGSPAARAAARPRGSSSC
jgi:hypothetical protein